jgi:hypothetical protein
MPQHLLHQRRDLEPLLVAVLLETNAHGTNIALHTIGQAFYCRYVMQAGIGHLQQLVRGGVILQRVDACLMQLQRLFGMREPAQRAQPAGAQQRTHAGARQQVADALERQRQRAAHARTEPGGDRHRQARIAA